jgi:hypothetical protein
MKIKYILSIIVLCCAFCASPYASANTGDGETTETKEATETSNEDLIRKILAEMPKISGYLQTGYNWGDENGDNRSSFQMKRMRLFIDKKISPMFDVRAQFEVFSGSTDGTQYNKKVMTVMDAFVTAHVHKSLHFRAGQFYLPLGFENYDISPATLEVVDFSNINLRMVCRNAVSTPNLIDYGRDIGILAYGDLFENKEKGFNYLTYDLSLTNGYLPTLNDDNKSKDFVGRLTFRPIGKLRIMGSYGWSESQGLNKENNPNTADKYLQMNRVIAGAWYYDPNGLNLRAEYGHMKSSEAKVKENGAYILAGYRVNKFLPVVRWETYRDRENKTSANNKDNYLVGCTYDVTNNFKFQMTYIHSIYTDRVKDAGVKDGSGNSIQIMCLAKF